MDLDLPAPQWSGALEDLRRADFLRVCMVERNRASQLPVRLSVLFRTFRTTVLTARTAVS